MKLDEYEGVFPHGLEPESYSTHESRNSGPDRSRNVEIFDALQEEAEKLSPTDYLRFMEILKLSISGDLRLLLDATRSMGIDEAAVFVLDELAQDWHEAHESFLARPQEYWESEYGAREAQYKRAEFCERSKKDYELICSVLDVFATRLFSDGDSDAVPFTEHGKFSVRREVDNTAAEPCT
jgi:hypothetical protein